MAISSFKFKLSELRCELREIYSSQVGSSNELTFFITYLHLFGNKGAKYQLSKILVFLMDSPDGKRIVSGSCDQKNCATTGEVIVGPVEGHPYSQFRCLLAG